MYRFRHGGWKLVGGLHKSFNYTRTQTPALPGRGLQSNLSCFGAFFFFFQPNYTQRRGVLWKMGAINKRYAPHIANYQEASTAPQGQESIWISGVIRAWVWRRVSKHKRNTFRARQSWFAICVARRNITQWSGSTWWTLSFLTLSKFTQSSWASYFYAFSDLHCFLTTHVSKCNTVSKSAPFFLFQNSQITAPITNLWHDTNKSAWIFGTLLSNPDRSAG